MPIKRGRISMFRSMSNMDDKESCLWKMHRALKWLGEGPDGDGGKAAEKFYADNREALEAGRLLKPGSCDGVVYYSRDCTFPDITGVNTADFFDWLAETPIHSLEEAVESAEIELAANRPGKQLLLSFLHMMAETAKLERYPKRNREEEKRTDDL